MKEHQQLPQVSKPNIPQLGLGGQKKGGFGLDLGKVRQAKEEENEQDS